MAIAAWLGVVGCSGDESGDGSNSGSGGNEGGSGFGVIVVSELQYSPPSLSFNAGVGSSGKVTVTNVGTQKAIEIRDVSLKVDTTAHFAIESNGGKARLQPLESMEVVVAFTPQAGEAVGTLVIEHDAPEQGPLQIPLFATTQGGVINVAPASLNFGPIPVGSSQEKSTTASSEGFASVRLASAVLTPDSSPAFKVALATLPANILPGTALPVPVVYEPSEVGDDSGTLVLTFEDADKGEALVPLFGIAIASNLVASPSLLDFGLVALGDQAELTLELRNTGQAAIAVDNVLPTFGTSEFVAIVESSDWPVTLGEGEKTSLTIAFTPLEDMPYSMDPIGGLSVASGGVGGAQFVVPIFGNVAAADLAVSPMFVDFGLVAKNDTVTRDVLLVNQGESAVTIQDVKLIESSGGEFAIAGWSPSSFGPGQPIMPEQVVTLTLAFTNTLAGSIATGSLEIVSTDPDEPVISVQLEAKRGGAKACSIVLEPAALNFGIVPHGHTKTMPIAIKNVGTGPCTFQNATTYDCGTGIFGFIGECSQGIGNQSKYFKIVGQPPPIPGGLPQGGKLTINVLFKPPTDAPILDFLDAYSGAIQVTVVDPSNGNAPLQAPVGATPKDLSPNLLAQSGITDIGVIPGEVDFGLITIGCTSKETKITVYNNGNAPLSISDIELIDCTPEFSLTQVPAIPAGGLVVNQANPVSVWVLYVPQVPGKAYCTLAVTSSDTDQPLLTVPLEGEGTFETERTDTFVQSSGKEVDILFVVDNSGSMSEEQQNLANNFQALVQEANSWGTLYHLGVVTTDMSVDSMSGRLQGSPRFVVPGPQAENQFQKNVKVGDSGDGAQEAGLEAAYRALSFPLIRETTTACTKNADCTAPDECIDGYCGGHNAGFLRKDATLEVVFVSDEEDQSPSQLGFYTDFLKSIKGFANANLMHAHAIVGDENGGCDSSDGNAEAGKRYIQVAKDTGGKIASICDSSFANALSDIGTVAFGLKSQFFLSAQAQPGTVKVTVDGIACTAGWQFDGGSNSVIFDDNGPCMPDEGQTIVINYKILCLQEGP